MRILPAKSFPLAGFIILTLVALAGAQSPTVPGRFALVIGNSTYQGMPALKNPANDASDMAAALRRLGFTVDLLLNADLATMEEAAIRMSKRLGGRQDSVGLFYFAGHGVQSAGTNYLIPSQTSIGSESMLRSKALSAQVVMDLLQESGNQLNLFILDACRDNPFGWSRSTSRGLGVMANQAPGSIVAYATSAGKTAADGTERNGVYTGELLKHLETPGIDLSTILDLTAKAVQTKTNNIQTPAIYKQYFDTWFFQARTKESPAAAVANTRLTRYDYHKILVLGKYLVGTSANPLVPNAIDYNLELGFNFDDNRKSADPHYVDDGTAMIYSGFNHDGKGRSWTDLYHVDYQTRRVVNLSNDQDLAWEVFHDYNTENKMILYSRHLADQKQELRLINTDASQEAILLALPVGEQISSACFVDAAMEQVLVVRLDSIGQRLFELHSTKSPRTPRLILRQSAVELEAQPMLWIRDVNYTSRKVLFHHNTPQWDRPAMAVLSLNQAQIQVLPESATWEDCLFSPDGEWISFSQRDKNTLSINTWNLASGTRYRAWFSSREIASGAYAFWLDRNRLAWVTMERGPEDSKGWEKYWGIVRLYQANANGKAATIFSEPKGEWFGDLHGQGINITYGLACPQVYLTGPDGRLDYVDEILKNARGQENRRLDTLTIPVSRLDDTAPRILLTEKLRESSRIFSIGISSNAGPVRFTRQGSDYLNQGETIELKLVDIPVDATEIQISVDGYYTAW